MKNPTVDTIPRVVHTINNSICLCDVMDIFFINKLFYSEIDSGLIGREQNGISEITLPCEESDETINPKS